MSLTVPTSGNVGGASANVQIATPDTGAVISEFGNRMAELGQKVKAQQIGYETRRAQLGMTNDLANARLEAEQLADPVASGQLWDQKKAEIYGKYLPTDANGKSTLDPQQQQELQLAFSDLEGKHTFALSEKAVNWNRQTAAANWLKSRDEITTRAVTADPETFGALLKLGEDEITAQEQQGLMDPATAETNRQALRQDVYLGRANAQIEADPQAFLDASDKHEFDALGGETLAAKRLTATQELQRREAAAAKDAEQAQTQVNTALKSRMGEITNIAKAGGTVADEDWLNSPDILAAKDKDPEVQAKWAEAQAAIQLAREIPNIKQMSPDQLAAEIAKEKASPKQRDYQVERLKMLTQWHDQAVSKWAADKVATAKEVGMTVPDLPEFDVANPDAFAAGLVGRIGLDRSLKDGKYGTGPGYFSNDEKAALKPVLAPEADAAAKLSLATAVASATKDQPDDVARAMGADDTFLRATRIIASTGDRALAAEILRGQQKIGTKTVVLPSEKTMTLTFDDITGGIYNNNPTLKAEVMNAARALYADGAGGLDPDQGGSGVSVMGVGWSTDPAAVSLFTSAVQRVTGATPDANGDLTVGGVQPINGGFVALPHGISAAAVERTLSEITDGLSTASALNADGTIRPVIGPGAQAGISALLGNATGVAEAIKTAQGDGTAGTFAPLLKASLYGGTPDLGPNAADRFSTLTLREVQTKKGQPSGVYEFVYTDNGSTYAIPQTDGRAYRFRLTDLIREAGQ